jgi:hypothetical protein
MRSKVDGIVAERSLLKTLNQQTLNSLRRIGGCCGQIEGKWGKCRANVTRKKNPEKKPDHQPTKIKKLTQRSTLQTLSRLRVCAPAT